MSNRQGQNAEQPECSNYDLLIESLRRMLSPSGPAIVANGIYSRTEVESRLGISNVTMSAWIEFNQLEPIQPGTKEMYFFGQDLIDWMRAHKKGIVKPKTAKAKAAARKAAT